MHLQCVQCRGLASVNLPDWKDKYISICQATREQGKMLIRMMMPTSESLL